MHLMGEEMEEMLVRYSHRGAGRGLAPWGGGGGECIYEDFSFFALGESAPWEFTPFTPLAKKNKKTKTKQQHIQFSYKSLITDIACVIMDIKHLLMCAGGFLDLSWAGDQCFADKDGRSPLSFFDLLLEGTCFFFKVWAWECSLHRRSWKLINFHIMKAWVRQMAARTVILIEGGGGNIQCV